MSKEQIAWCAISEDIRREELSRICTYIYQRERKRELGSLDEYVLYDAKTDKIKCQAWLGRDWTNF